MDESGLTNTCLTEGRQSPLFSCGMERVATNALRLAQLSNDQRFALLFFHIGSGNSQTLESEEALLPKLLNINNICYITLTTFGRGI